MDKIKYLLSLNSRQFIRAGMMIVIMYLAGRLTVIEYRNDVKLKEKDDEIAKKDLQIIEMEKAHGRETIKSYNKIIDGQTKRQDAVDSALEKVNNTLTDLKISL